MRKCWANIPVVWLVSRKYSPTLLCYHEYAKPPCTWALDHISKAHLFGPLEKCESEILIENDELEIHIESCEWVRFP